MKRARHDESPVEERLDHTDGGVDTDHNVDGQQPPTNKKLKHSDSYSGEEAVTGVDWCALPDVVVHLLVRELDLEDALRLHAVSTFWAHVVSRDHPVVGFLAKQLLPRLATLAAEGTEGDEEEEEESCDEGEGEEEAEQVKAMEAEVQEEVGSGEKELIDEELAWLMQDNEKTPAVEQTEKADESEATNVEPTDEASPPGMNAAAYDQWSLLQEVAIAARARLHELEIHTASYWQEVPFNVVPGGDEDEDEDDNGDQRGPMPLSLTSLNALQRGDDTDINEDEEDEDEEGIKRVKGPFPEATEQPVDPTEALSLAAEVANKNSKRLTKLRLDLPSSAAVDGGSSAAYFTVEHMHIYNPREEVEEDFVNVFYQPSPSDDRSRVLMHFLGSEDREATPVFSKQLFADLVSKMGLKWTAWQLASFVLRCAGERELFVRQTRDQIFSGQGYQEIDEGWGNPLLSRYDERPEWSDVTSIIRTHNTFSSPQRLHQILRIVRKWQYRLRLTEMWKQAADLDWPSSDQIARLASCVRSGWGQVAVLCGEYSNEIDGLSSFKLDIVVPSAGGKQELLQVKIQCKLDFFLAFEETNDEKDLEITARALNNAALERLGSERKMIYNRSSHLGRETFDSEFLQLIGQALDLCYEPNEDRRFYAPGKARDAGEGEEMEEEEENDETSDVDDGDDDQPNEAAKALRVSWEPKRIAYFLALCCISPANSYSGRIVEEDGFITGYQQANVWDLDPRQRVLETLDAWVNPDQLAPEHDAGGGGEDDCEYDVEGEDEPHQQDDESMESMAGHVSESE